MSWGNLGIDMANMVSTIAIHCLDAVVFVQSSRNERWFPRDNEMATWVDYVPAAHRTVRVGEVVSVEAVDHPGDNACLAKAMSALQLYQRLRYTLRVRNTDWVLTDGAILWSRQIYCGRRLWWGNGSLARATRVQGSRES